MPNTPALSVHCETTQFEGISLSAGLLLNGLAGQSLSVSPSRHEAFSTRFFSQLFTNSRYTLIAFCVTASTVLLESQPRFIPK